MVRKSCRRSAFFVNAFAATCLAAFMQVDHRSAVAQEVGAPANAKAQTEDAIRLRANELLKQMTPDEKMGQMVQLFVFGKPTMSMTAKMKKGEVGSILFVKDAALINQLQHVAVENSRLHIPMLFGFDVIHGLRTIFPIPLGMAASWDPDTVERAQSVAAQEATAVGIKWTSAPMVDIARDPRWGRIAEGAGEDPFLGSAVAAAQVRGFQGSYLGSPEHIVATVKHFAGYGAAEGGRDYDDVEISDSELWNVYLPPFRSAVDAGVGTLMSAYMDLNGVPASSNHWLLHDVLREEWKFRGFVVTDASAVLNLKTHGFAADDSDAALRAFKAGVNMEMAFGHTTFGSNLPEAYQKAKITDSELDEAVRPILETKLRLGLFEHPYVDEARAKELLNTHANRAEALRAAERSAVLLRNEQALLPLAAERYKKIAVIGPLSDSKWDVIGSWALAAQKNDAITPLEGLKKLAPAGTAFTYAAGVQISRRFPSAFDGIRGEKEPPAWTDDQAAQEFAKAVEGAKSSDIAVIVLGENANMSGEAASRSSLELPGEQERLLEAVVATGKPVVLVLMSARPLSIEWATTHVPAILDVWYPGTEGGTAIANLLYGKANPGGKLPITWPRGVGQVPMFYAHDLSFQPNTQTKRYWDKESTPLFPFGYGLSYTKFAFTNLRLANPTLHRGDSLDVKVDVTNQGDRAGDEVAQIYIHQQSGSSSRPVRELKGFSRAALEPRETKTLSFKITQAELTYWSAATKAWIQDAAKFDIWAGDDATAELYSNFEVVAASGAK